MVGKDLNFFPLDFMINELFGDFGIYFYKKRKGKGESMMFVFQKFQREQHSKSINKKKKKENQEKDGRQLIQP